MYRKALASLEDDGAFIDDARVITAKMRELFPDQLTDGHTPKP
jgi:hypothetical protein